MSCEKLSAKNLHLVHNGAAGILIDEEIRRAVTDLQDRGREDKKPRLVNIQIELAKVGDSIDIINVSAHAPLPKRRTGSTHAQPVEVKTEGQTGYDLWFQTLNAENADQPTFKEMENLDEEEVRRAPGE